MTQVAVRAGLRRSSSLSRSGRDLGAPPRHGGYRERGRCQRSRNLHHPHQTQRPRDLLLRGTLACERKVADVVRAKARPEVAEGAIASVAGHRTGQARDSQQSASRANCGGRVKGPWRATRLAGQRRLTWVCLGGGEREQAPCQTRRNLWASQAFEFRAARAAALSLLRPVPCLVKGKGR
jgi:hypothetical protein